MPPPPTDGQEKHTSTKAVNEFCERGGGGGRHLPVLLDARQDGGAVGGHHRGGPLPVQLDGTTEAGGVRHGPRVAVHRRLVLLVAAAAAVEAPQRSGGLRRALHVTEHPRVLTNVHNATHNTTNKAQTQVERKTCIGERKTPGKTKVNKCDATEKPTPQYQAKKAGTHLPQHIGPSFCQHPGSACVRTPPIYPFTPYTTHPCIRHSFFVCVLCLNVCVCV